MRGAYTRSMGGLYFDNSVRLEPTHVAGFNQAFRSLIPESVGGIAAGAKFETWGADVSRRLGAGTYLGVMGEWLRSDGRRTRGAFDRIIADSKDVPVNSAETFETLDFEERSIAAHVHQLLGREVSLGVRYRLSQANFRSRLPELRSASVPPAESDRDETSLLHQLTLSAHYAHPSGFFGEARAGWTRQENQSHAATLGGDEFWQFDLFAGYRFPRRQAELVLGLLNLTGQDYRLNPLNLHSDLPRQRTLLVSLRLSF